MDQQDSLAVPKTRNSIQPSMSTGCVTPPVHRQATELLSVLLRWWWHWMTKNVVVVVIAL